MFFHTSKKQKAFERIVSFAITISMLNTTLMLNAQQAHGEVFQDEMLFAKNSNAQSTQQQLMVGPKIVLTEGQFNDFSYQEAARKDSEPLVGLMELTTVPTKSDNRNAIQSAETPSTRTTQSSTATSPSKANAEQLAITSASTTESLEHAVPRINDSLPFITGVAPNTQSSYYPNEESNPKDITITFSKDMISDRPNLEQKIVHPPISIIPALKGSWPGANRVYCDLRPRNAFQDRLNS